MPRKLDPCCPALYKYQIVRYTHFDVSPGATFVLTSDPWSYLEAYLDARIKKTRGDNKKNNERALYYARLAKAFYEASNSIELPAKATLVYYGLLNLMKCFISTKGIELGLITEHHGLGYGENSLEVKINSPAKHVINIFHEMAKCLGASIQGKEVLSLRDVLAQIPEIHEIAYTLNLLPNNERIFVPVKIEFCVNEQKDRLFTEIGYEKKSEARIKRLPERFCNGHRRAYFRLKTDQQDWVIYRSLKKKHLTKTNCPAIYANIQEEYRRFHIWSILSRDGYKYYCNLSDPRYPQLCYVIMLMFYLGTVARYRPAEMGKLLGGEFSPVIREAVILCPMQYLYQMLSLITKSICVIPYALLR